MSQQYWAAKEPKEVASVLLNRAKSFYNVLSANFYIEKLRRCWEFYHGIFNSGFSQSHKVQFTGEQGEIVLLPVNHFRNIARHLIQLITSTRPSMDARSINTDYKSMSQSIIANGVLEYYMREKHLEDNIERAVEMAIVMGAGYVKLEWNATAGEMVDYFEETKETIYQGELEFSNLSPLDVVFDGTKDSWTHEWYLTRTWQNKFNLCAKYPELKDKIESLPTKNQLDKVYSLSLYSNDQTDDIPVYELFHKRTESMPDGRYLLFLDTDLILLDGKMPYRSLPIYRIVPAEILGTPYGYTPMFDLYPIQEALNSLYSVMMTNVNAHGVTNLFVKTGSDLVINSLSGGMNVVEGQEEPKVLQLTQNPVDLYKMIEILNKDLETLSAMNSVIRGNPEKSISSGTALALLQSNALQFMSGLQSSYVKLIESVGTSIIQILKDFATAPRVISIVGKNNQTYLKEFTGEDINSINRVIVESGNQLAKTTAGRVQMAEQLLQMKLLKNPEQYLQIINTGKLEGAYEGELKQIMLMRKENEKMMAGQTIRAIVTDQHKMHIEEHSGILSDPDLREDITVRDQILMHIQEHIDFLRSTDPDLLMLLNQQPLQPPAPMPPDVPMPTGGGVGELQIPPTGENANALAMQTASKVKPAQLPSPPPPFENQPVVPGQ
jgi:hypothetical protein